MEGIILMIQLLLDIEFDDKYFEIAKERLEKAERTKSEK